MEEICSVRSGMSFVHVCPLCNWYYVSPFSILMCVISRATRCPPNSFCFLLLFSVNRGSVLYLCVSVYLLFAFLSPSVFFRMLFRLPTHYCTVQMFIFICISCLFVWIYFLLPAPLGLSFAFTPVPLALLTFLTGFVSLSLLFHLFSLSYHLSVSHSLLRQSQPCPLHILHGVAFPLLIFSHRLDLSAFTTNTNTTYSFHPSPSSHPW